MTEKIINIYTLIVYLEFIRTICSLSPFTFYKLGILYAFYFFLDVSLLLLLHLQFRTHTDDS